MFRPANLQRLQSKTLLNKRFAHGFNEPTGYLFGEKPLPQGQKRVKEDWENIVVWPMTASIVTIFLIAHYFGGQRQEWAKEEAKRRLHERGEYPTYTPTLPAGVNFNPPHPDKA